MKISEKTLKVLKNFAAIHPSTVINELRDVDGNMVHTHKVVGGLGPKSPLFGFYDLLEEEKNLPEIPIADLNRFLAVMQEMMKSKEWDIIFEEDSMKIRTSQSEVKYRYSDKDSFPKRPTSLKIDDGYVMKLILKKENLRQMFSLSNILGYNSITIESKKGKISKDDEECYVVMGIVKDVGNSLTSTYKDIWGKNQKEYQGSVVFNSTSFTKMLSDYDYEILVYTDRVVFNALEEVKVDGKIELKPVGLKYLIPANSQK